MKHIVVAYDQNRGIGAKNDLLWQRDLPADLKHFKELTMGSTVIMGRKTFQSIGRALPGRQNIVISHNSVEAEDITGVSSLEAAYAAAEHEIFIIGGGSIYEQALGDADIIHATEVHASFPVASVFFPALGTAWRETTREEHDADERNKYTYDFVTYTRN